MPHGSLKVIPGVDTNKTPALNEAAISSCNLIRFMPDPSGIGLVQKLGGWTNYYAQPTATKTRALWPWEDTNANTHLAVGNQASTNTFQAQLSVISNNSLSDITPRSIVDNVVVSFTTVTGSNAVTITDNTTTASSYDSVFISTPVSVGGIVLSGFYQCTFLSSNSYIIFSTDILGNALPATATITNGGLVPQFTTTNLLSTVTITLANHGYVVGGTFSVLVPLFFNGITFLGNYTIQTVPTLGTFTIQASTTANASSSTYLNNGNANFVYYIGLGPVPAGTGYGIGGYGSGVYGAGSSIVPSIGSNIYTNDWTLDNFGQILVACPVPSMVIPLTPTSASGSGTVATLTFATNYQIPVGNVVIVSGMTPPSYNGTFYATTSSSNTVSYASSATGVMTVAGSVVTEDIASGPIFQWDPTSGNPTATVIQQAPPVCDGIFVAMPQRQIIAWGTTFTGIQDPLLLRWCDVQNYQQWIAQSTNQAGSYRIPKGSRIVGCIQGPQQGLVWTDLAVWSMQYIGQPYIYAFNEIATGCGLISRKAAGSFNGVVYWMGQSQFFKLSGDGVTPIPCPVWDVVFQNLDTANLSKIRVAVNSRFNEVAWYYPTLSSNGEVAAYVKYNTVIGCWDYGTLARSAWINESVLGPPIGADPNSLFIYQHETSNDAAGQAMNSYYQTGYFVLQEADFKTFIDQVWPDAKWGDYNAAQSATLNLTFYVTDYPGTTPIAFGPYPVTYATTWISPRFRGRLVSVYVSSTDVGSFWRIGALRYRYSADGKY